MDAHQRLQQTQQEAEALKLSKLQALNEKEKALQQILEEKKVLKEHEAELLEKYNKDLSHREEALRKQEQLRNQLLAQADFELAKRLQAEYDDEIRKKKDARRTQLKRDREYASHLKSSRRRQNPDGGRHARGVSTAEQTRFGTVRKKMASDIRMGEQVKTKQGHKGVVKFDGNVDGLGHVLGLDVFLGRGNHDGKYNGKRYFRCKKKHGLFVPLADITHVYRENKNGEKEKIRFTMPRGGDQPHVGEGGPAGGEDDMFMQNAMQHLGAVHATPASMDRKIGDGPVVEIFE